MNQALVAERNAAWRTVLYYIATAAGPVALAAFTAVLWKMNQTINLASMTMWCILDIFFAVAMYKAGEKKDAAFPAAYAVVAAAAILVIAGNGVWTIGAVEVISAALVAFAMWRWYKSGPVQALVFGGIAITVSCIPVMADALTSDMKWTWWLWSVAALSAWTLLALTPKWTLKNALFNGISAAMNTILVVLVLL